MITPESQKQRSQEQLLMVISDFMMNEIIKLSKGRKKKHRLDKQYKSSGCMSCSVRQYSRTTYIPIDLGNERTHGENSQNKQNNKFRGQQ